MIGIRKLCIAISLVVLTALLAGCFQIERTVRLNPDGSGTVEEIVLIGKSLTGMFDAMETGTEQAATDKTSDKAPAKKSFFEGQEKSAREKVAKMGEGVTVVSVLPVTRGDFEGYQATYGFKDINKLKLPSDSTPADQGADSGKSISYQLTGDGAKKTLVVKHPPAAKKPATQDQPESQPAADGQQTDQAGLDLLKQMFNGMKIVERIAIVNGTVLETNALFRSGPEITMVDVDFGKLLSTNPAELTKLQAVPPNDKEKLLQAMGKIEGFRVDMNEELRVVFKGGK